MWWFANKSGLNGDCGYQIKYYYNGNSNSYVYQASAARLCDEIVSLWRLAALNPAISPKERISLCWKFKDWHFKIIDLVIYENFVSLYRLERLLHFVVFDRYGIIGKILHRRLICTTFLDSNHAWKLVN